VLARITLHAARGERVAIIGASGAGKTSLLRLLGAARRLHQPIPPRQRAVTAFSPAGSAHGRGGRRPLRCSALRTSLAPKPSSGGSTSAIVCSNAAIDCRAVSCSAWALRACYTSSRI